MHIINEFPGREVKIAGKNYLYFGGTSYLGLQTDKAFQSLYYKNMKRYGTGYGASRKSNIQLSIYKEMEEYLAQLVGSERCLTMSSGYLAGQLLHQYLIQGNLDLYYAPGTHSALSNVLAKKHVSKLALTKDLMQHPEQDKVLMMDSIDFKGENYPDYQWLTALPLHKMTLVIDDSHGIGITGINGGGSYKFLDSLRPKNLLVTCSLGKGYGIGAGAIFGTRAMIDSLMDTEMFGGSSPAAPAALATLRDAESIIDEKRNLLKRNLTLFLKNLKHPSQFSSSKGHPTFSFQNEKLALTLEQEGIIVTNFRYPTANNDLMSRIVISALHTTDDILTLCNSLNQLQSY
ncbi:aminotransferase class I/II-fold pyridoxal phosphate-dependent enzyme [Maribacter sp. LLG6340-A2]|uniref:aminotransferase class I/II-fold pyridoxal phosphate-dependent enzyme n=1 Tax=Maribacter sp. LLG6340-A2 TaxID=3160834 RepID=UPI0038631355